MLNHRKDSYFFTTLCKVKKNHVLLCRFVLLITTLKTIK
jgi:hypothetical protein